MIYVPFRNFATISFQFLWKIGAEKFSAKSVSQFFENQEKIACPKGSTLLLKVEIKVSQLICASFVQLSPLQSSRIYKITEPLQQAGSFCFLSTNESTKLNENGSTIDGHACHWQHKVCWVRTGVGFPYPANNL